MPDELARHDPDICMCALLRAARESEVPAGPLYRWMEEVTAQLVRRDSVLGFCPHGVDLDHAFCPDGCRV